MKKIEKRRNKKTKKIKRLFVELIARLIYYSICSVIGCSAIILFFGTIYHFYDLRLYKDDSLMRAIAAGTYTGTPDGHLLYIKYIFIFNILWSMRIDNLINIQIFISHYNPTFHLF